MEVPSQDLNLVVAWRPLSGQEGAGLRISSLTKTAWKEELSLEEGRGPVSYTHLTLPTKIV